MARTVKIPLILLSLGLFQLCSFVSSEKWITDKCAAMVRTMPHLEGYESQDQPRCYIFDRCCEKYCEVKPAATQCRNDTFCCACSADDEPACGGANQDMRTTILDEPSSTASKIVEHLTNSPKISTIDMSSTASISTPDDDESKESSADSFDKSSTSDLLSILTTFSDSIPTTDSNMQTNTEAKISVVNLFTKFSDITTNGDNTVWTQEDWQTDPAESTTSWPLEETSQAFETTGDYTTESGGTTEFEMSPSHCVYYNNVCNVRREFLCKTKSERCDVMCPEVSLCEENFEVCEKVGAEICSIFENLCLAMKSCKFAYI